MFHLNRCFRFNYGRLVVYLGLLLSNLEKAISYGDGDRETSCLKLTIPIFRRMGRTKYAQSMLRRVVMIKSVLSEADAYEYRHNTTIGLGVGPGRRKSVDYYMELLNNILSRMIGKTFTLETMMTTANALGYLHTIKKLVEEEIRGIKRKKNKRKEVGGIYEKLLYNVKNGELFKFAASRKSPAGLSIKKNIHYDNRSKITMTNWMLTSK